MILHRPLDPATAAEATPGHEHSPFTASWADTVELLQREANHLSLNSWQRRSYNVDVYVEVDLPASAIRLDGGIKANAPRERSDIIAVTIPTRDHGDLRMVSARYTSGWAKNLSGWQSNVRAVALTLEALRSIERWGAATGQQYAGFAALGAGQPIAVGGGLSPAEASALLAEAAGADLTAGETMTAADARWAYRVASKTAHPDRGGDPELFRRLTEARDLLVGVGARG